MANPISSVSSAQHASNVSQVHQNAQVAKQPAAMKAEAPQDTVNISAEGKAASQSKIIVSSQKPSGDTSHKK